MIDSARPEPKLRVQARRVSPGGEPHRWSIEWGLENRTEAPIAVFSVRIPHDQFRAEDRTVDPPVVVDGASTAVLISQVRCAEPPGATLTYPFLILQSRWCDRDCRFYTRLRVEMDGNGIPNPICEETTAQVGGPHGA